MDTISEFTTRLNLSPQPKAMSAFLSGEMKDTALLNPVASYSMSSLIRATACTSADIFQK